MSIFKCDIENYTFRSEKTNGIFFTIDQNIIFKYGTDKYTKFKISDDKIYITFDNSDLKFKDIAKLTNPSRRINSYKNTNYKFDIYVINLERRIDRYKNVLKTLEPLNLFNIKFYKAIENKEGYIGCALSHLDLIKYAYENDLDFIVVAEDDIVQNKNINYPDTIKNILDWLENNLDKWDIFNGGPTFWNKTVSKTTHEIVATQSKNDDLINLNWGQCTHFIVYNKSVYKKMFDFLESEEGKNIDEYIAENFKQTVYKHGFLFYQLDDYSDVKQREFVHKYHYKCEDMIKLFEIKK